MTPGTECSGGLLVGHQSKGLPLGKALMPGGFIPPEQMEGGPRGSRQALVGRADKKEPAAPAPAAPDMGGMY